MSIRRTLEEREASARPSILASLAGHVLLFLLLGLSSYLWAPTTLLLGGGAGGGSGGDLISVGLVEELSGGAGMYKPSIVAQPQAAPPPPPEKRVEQAPPAVDETVFLEKEKSRREKTPEPVRSTPAPKKAEGETNPAAIPQTVGPGSGGSPSASLGGGGGQGSGLGIQIGMGRGGPGIDSWYVRQLEQRVGQNWLRTSLQGLNRRVKTEISFEVRRNGTIENIEIVNSSGVSSVDQAARRAVLASNPLPPVPAELRGRNLRVVAVFEYPPP